MKKMQLLFAFFLVIHSYGHAQTMKDLFQPSDVKFYWFGIDYTHVQLIGSFNQFLQEGINHPDDIKNTYFPAWNGLFVREFDKYNVSAMLHGKEIETKIVPMFKLNDKIDPLKLDTINEKHYSADEIKVFVKDYDFEIKEGIGVFFLAESLNKKRKRGIYHIVFLNLSTNEVLHTESFTGKAGGFGIRNYYAKSFRIAMETIRDRAFKKWQKQYLGE